MGLHLYIDNIVSTQVDAIKRVVPAGNLFRN